MNMNTQRLLAWLAILSCLGCSERATQTPTTTQGVAETPPAATSPGSDTGPATPAIESSPYRLAVKSWDETQQAVAAQKGKVVVLDLWSTWCVPCVREFPNLVKLQRDHPMDVVCLGFNLDYSGAAGETPESFRAAVGEFLTKQGASFENVISRDAADDVFQRLKLGSIPAVLVYGPDGQLTKRFDNDDALYGDDGFTYDKHIVPWVEQLLARDGVPASRERDD
jgi:thiol-disulfide isomerase/thioredoxin